MELTTCSLNALLQEFAFLAENPGKAALEWKNRTGGKVMGVAGLDVPEVMLHAAGILPIVLLDKNEQVTLANAHVEMHQCGYIRSLVDQALKGDLQYCDEILFHDCCHIVRMLGDAMGTFSDKIPKAQFIYFSPLLAYKTGQRQVMRELAKLRERLEATSGVTITHERLMGSIRLFNRQRSLFIQLYDIRRAYPGILRAVDVSNIVAASMCMPREDNIPMMERLLALLEEKKAEPVSKKIPVVVHGSLCERCDDYVLNCIESAGGVVVDDDLYVGSRYFNVLYDESVQPMDAILKAYIERKSPCPTRYEERNPGDYLAEMVKNSHAKGIIMVVVKFCEAHDYSYFTAQRRLAEVGIPEMLVETEHDSAPEGQLKTRLQAFFESMEA